MQRRASPPPAPTEPPRPARERLLRAAAAVTARNGYAALTLDSVAAEAGVSKGGLLYHFPSKDTLVTALVEERVAQFEAALSAALAREPEASAGRWTRAYVRASLSGPAEVDLAAGLVAATALDPALLDPLRARYVEWARQLDRDGLAGVDAQIVRLAVDGLWLCELLGLGVPSTAQRKKIIARLVELAGKAA